MTALRPDEPVRLLSSALLRAALLDFGEAIETALDLTSGLAGPANVEPQSV